MTEAKAIVKKVEVSNVGNTKRPRWDGKKGDSYLMWKVKYMAHMVMLGLDDALNPDFEEELPTKEKDTFNLTSDKGKNWANAVKKNNKAMMQFALSFTTAGRTNKDWPSGKAHEVMTQLVKEYKPDDTMAKMEMAKALSKLTLGKKKDPNNLLDAMSAIECRYKIDLTESKKKAQVFQIRGAQYSSIISTTQMIYKSKEWNLHMKSCLKKCIINGKLQETKIAMRKIRTMKTR